MGKTPSLLTVSPKLKRYAKLAREAPELVFNNLHPALDECLLIEAHRAIRKDGATGVDGMTASKYEQNLQERLLDLLRRAKDGSYQAPPVRRVHIPKGKGKTRPIGIPTFEDKILQRAVAWILEAVYEQDFLPMSYGFRPGRSAHDALADADKQLMDMGGGSVIEIDIKGFFDAVDHGHLREILGQRINDGVILRLIGKWLNAGIMEDGEIHRPDKGTPQGGVISPVLANIYLHEVFDTWFAQEVVPRMNGRCFAVRYADDIVIGAEHEEDAQRIFDVLPKRFEKYALTLHPEKTRRVDFRRPHQDDRDDDSPDSFDLLGFTFYWGRSRRGRWVVKRKTAKDRLNRAIQRVWDWLRRHRHMPVGYQHLKLCQKVLGHYAYYGVTFNSRALKAFLDAIQRAWWYWLSRRSQRGRICWDDFNPFLERHPLPSPRIVHPLRS